MKKFDIKYESQRSPHRSRTVTKNVMVINSELQSRSVTVRRSPLLLGSHPDTLPEALSKLTIIPVDAYTSADTLWLIHDGKTLLIRIRNHFCCFAHVIANHPIIFSSTSLRDQEIGAFLNRFTLTQTLFSIPECFWSLMLWL